MKIRAPSARGKTAKGVFSFTSGHAFAQRGMKKISRKKETGGGRGRRERAEREKESPQLTLKGPWTLQNSLGNPATRGHTLVLLKKGHVTSL